MNFFTHSTQLHVDRQTNLLSENLDCVKGTSIRNNQVYWTDLFKV